MSATNRYSRYYGNRYESTWGTYYCRVRFRDTAITLDNQWMMNYNPNQWYDIEVQYDATTRKASVWIDGALKADQWNVYAGGVGYTALALSSGHGNRRGLQPDLADRSVRTRESAVPDPCSRPDRPPGNPIPPPMEPEPKPERPVVCCRLTRVKPS